MINAFIQLSYIDPSAVSGVIVAVVGGIAAVSASAIIVWRKLKNKVNKTLHIDPNANKEVEEDIVLKDEDIEK